MPTRLIDQSGAVVFTGEQRIGGTPGQVATVQANGTIGPAPGGGTQPLEVLTFPLAFNTPNILTGIPLYTPEAGELLTVLGYFSQTQTWDAPAAIPQLNIYSQGDDPDVASLYSFTLASAPGVPINNDSASGTHAHEPRIQPVPNTMKLFADATPVFLSLSDGAGGNPGCTQGTGVLVLVLQPPT